MKNEIPGYIPEHIRTLLIKQSSTILSADEEEQLYNWYQTLDMIPAEDLLGSADREAEEKKRIWLGLEGKIQETTNTGIYRMKPWIWRGAAAVLLFVILGVGGQYLLHSKKTYQLEVATNIGKVQHLILPDGSQVWLNANSQLQYNNWKPGKAREVVLNGEAFFDIKQQAGQPFIIHTRAVDINVLGTSFNVKAYPEDATTETTLLTGKVQVVMKQEQGRKIQLEPSQKLVVQNNPELENIKKSSINKKHTTDTVSYLIDAPKMLTGDSNFVEVTWRERRLTFFNQPFEVIALQLQRWYGITVIFNDETMKNARFTGTFRDEPLTRVMTALQMSAPFNYRMSNDTLLIDK
ncbi:FecR family protein [Chitinophaga niastensis]|uniref:FecR family protein n=1 Tax=Chitinophaga niastensis TaxID=536980 RepID=A0A2P8HS14_CHINA|nr:FecR domain-containing protein [Chitinophaga niastensis]PSL48982.1 FecR family protein [Chitinophaga niastensis]